MGLELMAIAGILLLGAGITILVVNLRKTRGSASLPRPDRHLWLRRREAAAGGGRPGRRPLDSLAGRLGDIAAGGPRDSASQRCAHEAHLRRHVRDDAAEGPRLPGPRRDLPRAADVLAGPVDGRLVRHGGRPDRRRRRASAGSRRIVLHRAEEAVALHADRPSDAGHDRPPRRHDRGRPRHPRVDARRLRQHVRPARPGAPAHASGAAHGSTVEQAIESLGRRADMPNMRIFVRSLTQGERLGVSIGDDDAQPRARDAEAAEGDGRGDGPEDARSRCSSRWSSSSSRRCSSSSSCRWRSTSSKRSPSGHGNADAPPGRRSDRLRALSSSRTAPTGACAACSGGATSARARGWCCGPAGASTRRSCASRSTPSSSTRIRS